MMRLPISWSYDTVYYHLTINKNVLPSLTSSEKKEWKLHNPST